MNRSDLILDRLDAAWQSGCIPDLSNLLSEARPCGLETRVELCAADMEWRWRKRWQPLELGGSDPSRLPPQPMARHYRDLLQEDWADPECQLSMFQSEWTSRSAWGDTPHIDSFIREANCSSLSREQLLSQLDLISQLKLAVFAEDEKILERYAPSTFTVGRQNQHEPSPPAWISTEDRLILTGLLNRRFSRVQMQIRRVRIDEIELTNLSRSVSLQCLGRTVKYDQVIPAKLPFSFSSTDHTLVVFAES